MSAKALAFAAFLLIGSGVLTGALPITSGGSACGSAFIETTHDESISISSPADQRSSMAGCDDVRNLVRIPAIVLIAAGAATMLAAAATRWRVTVVKG